MEGPRGAIGRFIATAVPVAMVAVAGSVFGVPLAGVAGVAGTAPAGAVTPATITTIVVATGTVANGAHTNLTVPCPAGMFAVGGGIGEDEPTSDPNLLMTSDSPGYGGKFLVNVADGPNLAPDSWVISMYNASGSTKMFKGGVICTTPGGDIGPLTSVVASAPASAGAGAQVAQVQCPGNQQAVGGGIDDNDSTDDFIETSAPLIGSSHVITLPGTQSLVPSGWTGSLVNTSKVAGTVKVAAICADQTGLKPFIVTWAQPDAGATETGSTCPTGTEVTSVGVDSTMAFKIEQLSPTFGDSTLEQTPDGVHAPADGSDGLVAGAAGPGIFVTATCVQRAHKVVTRLSGSDRIATAIAISADSFPTAGSAGSVVLARSDPGQFADALVGTPLAVQRKGPLLLTPGAALDPRTLTEIARVLPAAGTVYLLGGESALSPAVASALVTAGFVVIRYGGTDRFDTATKVADALGDPKTIFEATGLNFPDALAAGTAAAALGGAVLLTADAVQSPTTAAYLTAHPPTTRYGVGVQAATADPGATPLAGTDRYDTAARVAGLFSSPPVIGAALGTNYPDALAGGAHIAAMHGPLILVAPSAPLPAATQALLTKDAATIVGGYLYGGTAVVGDDVVAALVQAIS